ncbi:hypothetical protein ACHMW5_13615 [Azospirillum melinis]|uniref:hypothetical protein n=1 Tax=Azospirillum melinis TaxID=328839 RepID=UPI00375741CA
MTDAREIRIRGAVTDDQRRFMLEMVSKYEREHLGDGRGVGLRNCVIWTPVSAAANWKAYVYHTKTAIVGVYQEARHD